ncbi:amidase [Rhodospirillum sp. A1_3_36]|uniref:amidase n=1 Tax=Rhodospirillum sp. A1_3_36 TaxID=3391666 RepID=UPI0039A60453
MTGLDTDLDLDTLRLRTLPGLIASGAVTAEAVALACLTVIDDREPEVRAWAHLDRERVLTQACAIDREEVSGLLAGAPLAIKDVIDTVDWPTEYGSAIYRGNRPAWDAPCVALARTEGAVVLGKAVSTEFAMASPGPTRNPWNPAHTPGGSSSGSCAAVAAGMALAGYGTQTAGSVIRPAAYCGVVGYKPSFGLLDRTAIKVLSDSLDTLGLITRDARDAAWLAAVLSGRPGLAGGAGDGDAGAAFRVGVYRTSRWGAMDPSGRAGFEATLATLANLGLDLVELEDAPWFEDALEIQDQVMGWEVTRALAFERLTRFSDMAPVTQAFLEAKAQVGEAGYLDAKRRMAALPAALARTLGDVEILLTPAAPGPAPEGLDATGDPLFNRAWTAIGAPCLTLPTGIGPGGLPLGLQVVGRRGEDARVLALAARVEGLLDRVRGPWTPAGRGLAASDR